MIRTDPENNETHALLDMVNFSGKHVLEIGCGDGRLTWRYADKASSVIAIDVNGSPWQGKTYPVNYKAESTFMQPGSKPLPPAAHLRYSTS